MIEINEHSSVKITGENIIYIDPFKIKETKNDADIILITHDHYDHLSKEDIKKVIKDDTIIVMPETTKETFTNQIIKVKPNQTYEIKNIKIETIPAYNINKPYHPKENNWVGYIITINNQRIYIAGDTDITEENKQIKCDIALVPVGGIYTMTPEEAAKLVNIIKPKIAIPTHYGSITGTKEDGLKFKRNLDKNIECQIYY